MFYLHVSRCTKTYTKLIHKSRFLKYRLGHYAVFIHLQCPKLALSFMKAAKASCIDMHIFLPCQQARRWYGKHHLRLFSFPCPIKSQAPISTYRWWRHLWQDWNNSLVPSRDECTNYFTAQWPWKISHTKHRTWIICMASTSCVSALKNLQCLNSVTATCNMGSGKNLPLRSGRSESVWGRC